MAPSPEQTATKLIAAGQYGDVAPELDIIELQVVVWNPSNHLLDLVVSKG